MNMNVRMLILSESLSCNTKQVLYLFNNIPIYLNLELFQWWDFSWIPNFE